MGVRASTVPSSANREAEVTKETLSHLPQEASPFRVAAWQGQGSRCLRARQPN